MDSNPFCLVKLGPWEFMCRNTDWDVAETATEFKLEPQVAGGPTLLSATRNKYSAKRDHSRYSSTPQEEPECEADACDKGETSPVSRWFSVTSDLTGGWSFAGSVSGDYLGKNVDLSGDWVLDRVEGRIEDLMTESGVSWSLRKLAQAANYGAGVVHQVIKHDGDKFAVEFQNLTSATTSVQVGTAKQETSAEDGTPILASAHWEGSSLWIEAVNRDTGAPMHKSRRYIQDGEMIQETIALDGFSVKRIFHRV